MRITPFLPYLLMLIPIFGWSCSDHSKKLAGPVVFNRQVALSAFEYEPEIICQPPSQIELVDSVVLFFRPGGCAAKRIDIRTGEDLGPAWYAGKGPDEFLQPYFTGQDRSDSTFTLFDMPLGSFTSYKWRKEQDSLRFDLLNRWSYSAREYPLAHTVILDNGYIVSEIASGADSVLVLLNPQMEFLKNFCNPLHENLNNELHPDTGRSAYWRNKFVFATINFGYICCYDVSDSGELKLNWEYLLEKPVYTTKPRFKFDDQKNPLGFYDVKMTDRYILCLYSGSTIASENSPTPKNLLIFDHHGKPLVHVLLDRHIGRFDVTPDGKTIYAYDPRLSKLLRYDLSGIFE